MKNRILFLGQFPPPYHGVSVINEIISTSKIINENYELICLPINSSSEIKDILNFSLKKLLIPFKILPKLLILKLNKKFSYAYFTITPLGIAFYRDALFVLFLKLFRVHFIFHLHGKGLKNFQKSSIFNWMLYYLVFRNSDVIVLSEILANDVDNLMKVRIHIVNNGIGETVHIEKKDFCDVPLKILSLSNLVASKGVIELINAVELLYNEGISNISVTIAGNEGDLTYINLKDLVIEKNVEHLFNFIGPVYGDVKENLFRENNLFVFPTYYDREAFPLVLLEAMRLGLPIISADNGGIPDIIDDNINGFIIERKNTQQLKEKIKYFIDNPKKLEAMGKEAKKKYDQNYTSGNFEKKLLNVFKEVLQPR